MKMPGGRVFPSPSFFLSAFLARELASAASPVERTNRPLACARSSSHYKNVTAHAALKCHPSGGAGPSDCRRERVPPWQ